MSDIVERLKKQSTGFDVFCAAADEIESLRQRVKELEEAQDSFYMDYRIKCDEETKRLEVELAALKAGQGEPVAWRWKHNTTQWTNYRPEDCDAINWQPLYTSAPTIPEGWQLVPVEPTEEMGDVGAAYNFDGFSAVGIYKAMLAAAPKPEE